MPTQEGASVSILPVIEIYALPAPMPAENPAREEDRDQAIREWQHYQQWPYELVVRQGGETAHFYGREAYEMLVTWTSRSKSA